LNFEIFIPACMGLFLKGYQDAHMGSVSKMSLQLNVFIYSQSSLGQKIGNIFEIAKK